MRGLNKMSLQKLERFAQIALILSAILMLLGQGVLLYSQQRDLELEREIITGMSIEVKFQEVRAAMNEALLRYIIGVNPQIKEDLDSLSLQTNRSFTVERAINDYFDPETELIHYFVEVDNLNSMRPEWEKKSMESLIAVFQSDADKLFWLRWFGNALNFLAFVSLILGLVSYFKAFKRSRDVSSDLF